ncbi:hypothetical protein FACS189483_00610 [Spirochaetia bacterium]|nr:hypothetical protein FACS189483_00610 [Spirochaetia bacterium]
MSAEPEHDHHHTHDGHEHNHGYHDHDTHEHSHEHHHDHDHSDHGHSHEHDHDEHDFISISHHEESIIAVFRRSITESYSGVTELAEARMRVIAEAITAKGGIIGHIKAIVTAEGDRCMLSLTDAGVGVQKRPLAGESANLELVVIVFCIEADDLREIIRSAMAEYIQP